MVAHPGLIQQLLTDEQISLIDRAAVNRQRREITVRVSPSSASRASSTGPMLPCAVLSKVEQYLK